MKKINYSILFIIIYFTINIVEAQKVSMSGMAAGWLTANPESPFGGQAGFRYIPEINYKEAYQSNISFDANLSLNIYANASYLGNDTVDLIEKLKPYRFWVRYSSERVELRGGLQKINFGSAQLLRPLMWFDKIDPRDPLQMTDGVYGGLVRLYFLNNANIWFWTLIANDELKGWEFIPTIKSKPEFGGRIQLPLLTGEIAGTYHYRKGDIDNSFADTLTNQSGFNENRIGLDFKLDYEIGFWFEGAIIHQDVDYTNAKYQQLYTLGMDYTFRVGNGLSLISEVFSFGASEKVLTSDQLVVFSALSLNYPISIVHSINGMIYYDFDNTEIYRFINWSMQFDKWSFYVMGYWNPDTFQIYNNVDEASLFTGKGFQLMAVFNH